MIQFNPFNIGSKNDTTRPIGDKSNLRTKNREDPTTPQKAPKYKLTLGKSKGKYQGESSTQVSQQEKELEEEELEDEPIDEEQSKEELRNEEQEEEYHEEILPGIYEAPQHEDTQGCTPQVINLVPTIVPP